MTLEEIGNWQGNIADIGALYPMAGSEGVLTLLLIVFWIGWHVWQFRMENSNYADDLDTLRQNGNMDRVLQGERLLRSL